MSPLRQPFLNNYFESILKPTTEDRGPLFDYVASRLDGTSKLIITKLDIIILLLNQDTNKYCGGPDNIPNTYVKGYAE